MTLDSLREYSENDYVSPINIAAVYIGIGENQKAIVWLEKALEEKEHRLVRLKIDPIYDPLRSNPRFQKLIERMNFPK